MSIKNEKTNKAICCIFPIVALSILYYYCITRCHMQFLSNDETSIHSILSGEYSGTPYPLHQYINCILSLVISGMYKAIPDIRWWYFYSHVLMLIGSWLIGYFPDCVRAAMKGNDIIVRNPNSVRPYQHVLEPVFAYLLIAGKQMSQKNIAGSYNIGPNEEDCIKTGKLVDLFCKMG